MAVTGAFLILFVTFHAVMNGVALFWPTAYNVVCEFLGANWYALVGTVVIAAAVVFHIIYALWLTVQNRRARGHERYNVTSKPAQVEWSSKNMLVLGIVVLAFLVLHFIQFWAKMQFAEICEFKALEMTDVNGNPIVVSPAAGTLFLQMAFSNWVVLAAYIVGFVALWFHLTHGFWSMFQSCGWNGRTWLPRLQKIGNGFITFVIALFIAEAVVFSIQANRGYYTSDPALLEQYAEMAATHNGEADAPYVAADRTPCGKAVCPKAACADKTCAAATCADGEVVAVVCQQGQCVAGQCANTECAAVECAGCAQCPNANNNANQ